MIPVKKAVVEQKMYSIVDIEEVVSDMTPDTGKAVEQDGYVYPVRNISDTRPGIYSNDTMVWLNPVNESNAHIYQPEVIDFSNLKDIKDVISSTKSLAQMQNDVVVTTADNLYKPSIRDNDSALMTGLKQVILNKNIDITKYADRFGNDYQNKKRALENDKKITVAKLQIYAEAFDFNISVTLSDKSPDVPNPMGEPITVNLNGFKGE